MKSFVGVLALGVANAITLKDYESDAADALNTAISTETGATQASNEAAVAAMEAMMELLDTQVDTMKTAMDSEKSDYEKDVCSYQKTIDAQKELYDAKMREMQREQKAKASMRQQELMYEQQMNAYEQERKRIDMQLNTLKGEIFGVNDGDASTRTGQPNPTYPITDGVTDYTNTSIVAGSPIGTNNMTGKVANYWSGAYAELVDIHVRTQKAMEVMPDSVGNIVIGRGGEDLRLQLAHSDKTVVNMLQKADGSDVMKQTKVWLSEFAKKHGWPSSYDSPAYEAISPKGGGYGRCTTSAGTTAASSDCTDPDDHCEYKNTGDAFGYCTLKGVCLSNCGGDASTCLYEQDTSNTQTIVNCWKRDGPQCAGGCMWKAFQYVNSSDVFEAAGAHAAAAIFRIADDLEKQSIKHLRKIAKRIDADIEMHVELKDKVQEQHDRIQSLKTHAQTQKAHFAGLVSSHTTLYTQAKNSMNGANTAEETAKKALKDRMKAYQTFSEDTRQTMDIYSKIKDMVEEHNKIFDCTDDEECLGNAFSRGRGRCADIAGYTKNICVQCTDAAQHCAAGEQCTSNYMCAPASAFFLQTGMTQTPDIVDCASGNANKAACHALNTNTTKSQCHWDTAGSTCMQITDSPTAALQQALQEMLNEEAANCNDLGNLDNRLGSALKSAREKLITAMRTKTTAELDLENTKNELVALNTDKKQDVTDLDNANTDLNATKTNCDNEIARMKLATMNTNAQKDAMKPLMESVLTVVNEYDGVIRTSPLSGANTDSTSNSNNRAHTATDVSSTFTSFYNAIKQLADDQAAELAQIKDHCRTTLTQKETTLKDAKDALNSKTKELSEAEQDLLAENEEASNQIKFIQFSIDEFETARNDVEKHIGVCSDNGNAPNCTSACTCTDTNATACDCGSTSCTCWLAIEDTEGTDAGFRCSYATSKCTGGTLAYCKGKTTSTDAEARACEKHATSDDCPSADCEWTTDGDHVCPDDCSWNDFCDSDSDNSCSAPNGPYTNQDGTHVAYGTKVASCSALVSKITAVKACLTAFVADGLTGSIDDITECQDATLSTTAAP